MTLVGQINSLATRSGQEIKAVRSELATALAGKANASHTHLWADLTDKPTTFAPIIGSGAAQAVAGNDPRLTDSRTPTAHTHPATAISDSTATGRSVITAADASAARTAIGAGTSSLVIGTTGTTAKAGDYAPAWTEITSKPTTFAPIIGAGATDAVAGNDSRLTNARTPTAHTHPATDLSDSTATGRSLITAANAAAVRTTAGLDLVDNTSDATKNAAVSSLTNKTLTGTTNTVDLDMAKFTISQTTDPTKKARFSPNNSSTGTTNVYVLPNNAGTLATVGNTETLSSKTLASPIFTGTPTGLTKAHVGLSSADDTADAAKNVLSATKLTTARTINGTSFDGTANISITVAAAGISDSTATGRSLVTAADAAAARTAIGAGTGSSNLVIGTAATDAKAGDYQPTWTQVTSKPTTFAPIIGSGAADAVAGNDARLTDARTPLAHNQAASTISDSTAVGRSVLTAADAAAARTAIGAGTGSSNLALGTTNTTAKAGDYQPAWTDVTSKPTTFAPIIGATSTTAVAGNDSRLTDARTPTAHTQAASTISDSTTIGRGILTAADAAAVRTLTGAVDTTAGDARWTPRWASEAIINSAALATGYNDFPGGVLVDYDISLTHVVFRIADPAGLVGGSGNLTIQFYLGTATAAETTLVHTMTVAAGAGSNNTIATLGTPVSCGINSVLRAKITLGSATVAGPCHVQFRGKYVIP